MFRNGLQASMPCHDGPTANIKWLFLHFNFSIKEENSLHKAVLQTPVQFGGLVLGSYHHESLTSLSQLTPQRTHPSAKSPSANQQSALCLCLPAHRAPVPPDLLCRVLPTVSPPLRPVWRAARDTLAALESTWLTGALCLTSSPVDIAAGALTHAAPWFLPQGITHTGEGQEPCPVLCTILAYCILSAAKGLQQ